MKSSKSSMLFLRNFSKNEAFIFGSKYGLRGELPMSYNEIADEMGSSHQYVYLVIKRVWRKIFRKFPRGGK